MTTSILFLHILTLTLHKSFLHLSNDPHLRLGIGKLTVLGFFLWEIPIFRCTCSVLMYVKNDPEQALFLQGWGHNFRIYLGRRVFVSPFGLGITVLSPISSLHFYL